MSRNWDDTFIRWAQGPSITESERAKNAVRQIRQAISTSEKLSKRNISVFPQGSYRNRVNVRRNSDVDIGVVCYDTFFPDYNDDNVKKRVSNSFLDSDYSYSVFKNELEEALVKRFGRSSIVRDNKAINIKENSYRVDADVAAFFEHRRYTSELKYLSGIEMRPDNLNPVQIRNRPE